MTEPKPKVPRPALSEREQECQDVALLAFGIVDHIGDCLVDLESYLKRLEQLVGEGHVMHESVAQVMYGWRDTYNGFKRMLTHADRLNRYAKPTLYSEAAFREDKRAMIRWGEPAAPLLLSDTDIRREPLD